MTADAIKDAFDHLRDDDRDAAARGRGPGAVGGRLAGRHEREPRGDHEDRLAQAAAVARPRADADAGAGRAPRPRDRGVRRPRTTGRCGPGSRPPPARATPASGTAASKDRLPAADEAERDRRGRERRRRARRGGRAQAGLRVGADAVRPDVAAARRERALRLHREPHAGGRAGLLRAAQGAHLPADQLALPVRRPGAVAALDRHQRGPRPTRSTRSRRRTSPGSTCCRSARVVNDAKVTDHHAIIPTDDTHTLSRLSSDERRIYDLVARRFLAVFHPDARYEQTTIETEAAQERFRSRGKVLIDAGWRAAYGEVAEADRAATDDDEEREQELPPLQRGRGGAVRRGRGAGEADEAAGALHRGARCCARWRPPAGWSRTTRRPRR